MSNSSGTTSSSNPNAPQLLSGQYFEEKAYIAGNFLGAIFYGVATIIFFQCMSALFNPIDRTRRSIKWGLVAHAAAMFSALTLNAALSLDVFSISYVDNRGFSGTDQYPSGPYGYQYFIYTDAISVIPNAMVFLNACLADGFLLYRCYVIYLMNYWVIALPCLMYLASLGLSILITYYQTLKSVDIAYSFIGIRLGVSYFSISLSLNVLLTLMIATQLIRHKKNIRNAIGPATDHRLYNTVITMLVETCGLYAIASLLYIGPFGAASDVQGIFAPIFVNIQVIAPLLIILRVANRTALTRDVIATGNIDSIRFESLRSSTGGTRDGNPTSSMEPDGEILDSEPSAGADTIVEDVPL